MPSAFAINAFVNIGFTIVMFFLVPKLVAKFSKRNLVIATASFSAIATTLLTIFTMENVYVFMVLYNLANIGLIVFIMIVWALVTDCLDFTELRTGKRYDGTLFSIYSFSRKVGMGIGSALGSYSLGWVGFVAGEKSQSADVAEGVLKMYTGMPIVAFILIVIGVGLIFNLNKDRTNQMYQSLEARRAS